MIIKTKISIFKFDYDLTVAKAACMFNLAGRTAQD